MKDAGSGNGLQLPVEQLPVTAHDECNGYISGECCSLKKDSASDQMSAKSLTIESCHIPGESSFSHNDEDACQTPLQSTSPRITVNMLHTTCSPLHLRSSQASMMVLLPGQQSGWSGVVQFLVLVLVPFPQLWEQGPWDQGDQPPSPESETLPILEQFKWQHIAWINYLMHYDSRLPDEWIIDTIGRL